jgi:hypothetical protein
MKRTWCGRIRFLPFEKGGRMAPPERGVEYRPTAVVSESAMDDASLFDWSGDPRVFSVVVDRQDEQDDGWFLARVWPLVEGSPGSSGIVPGSRLLILEGRTVAAQYVVDSVDDG